MCSLLQHELAQCAHCNSIGQSLNYKYAVIYYALRFPMFKYYETCKWHQGIKRYSTDLYMKCIQHIYHIINIHIMYVYFDELILMNIMKACTSMWRDVNRWGYSYAKFTHPQIRMCTNAREHKCVWNPYNNAYNRHMQTRICTSTNNAHICP